MKKQFIFLLLFIVVIVNAQHKVTFTYDMAGNQINRFYCFGCASSSKQIKEVEALVEEDFEKFFPKDAISYYPNPVREELYIKWTVSDESYVNTISIYTMTGQLLKQYKTNINTENQNIQFQEYPSGVYILDLIYNNGEQKSIKIIKK